MPAFTGMVSVTDARAPVRGAAVDVTVSQREPDFRCSSTRSPVGESDLDGEGLLGGRHGELG